MTYEEAIEELKHALQHNDTCVSDDCLPLSEETTALAIEALEKQMPKKPNYDEKGLSKYWYCPTCGEVVFSKIDGLTISNEYNHEHCGGCGQRIDWSEEE